MSLFSCKSGKIACFYHPPIEVIGKNDFDDEFIENRLRFRATHRPLSTAHCPLHSSLFFRRFDAKIADRKQTGKLVAFLGEGLGPAFHAVDDGDNPLDL